MTTNIITLRLALETAERAIAIAKAQLPPVPVPPVPPDGDIISVHPGEDLQAAIDAAPCGQIIELDPEARYVVGMLHLPDKRGGPPVMIRTSGTLPNRRVQPGDALAILASGNPDRTIDGTGAGNWILDGLQFEASTDGHSDVIRFEDADDIQLSRILLVGGDKGQKRGICGNGRNVSLTRSHIANIFGDGQDSQCFCAWNGAGPYTLEDNYLEGASENVMFGGGDSATEADLPSNISIVRNTFTKNPAWRDQSGKAIKNLLEFKVGRGVHVADNTFEQSWTDAQDGWAIVLKSANQNGKAPWSVLEDFVFEDNVLSNIENGIKMAGFGGENPSGRTARLTIQRNQISCTGASFQAGGEIGGPVIIDANDIQQGGNLLTLYPGAVWLAGEDWRNGFYSIEALTFTNNISRDVPYGIKGDATASGEPSLQKFCLTYTYEGNSYSE